MIRVLAGLACVALFAVSVHATTEPRIAPTTWTVSQPQNVQAANVRILVGSSVHAIHAGF
jgi:hypothetical protein